MRWTIGKRLGLGFGLLFGVSALLGIGGVVRSATHAEQIRRVTEVTAGSMRHAAEVRYLVSDLLAAARQTVIATAKADSATVQRTKAEIDAALAGLRQATNALSERSDDEQTKQRCREIQAHLERWAREASRIQEFAAQGMALEAAEASDAAKPEGVAAQKLAQDVFEEQQRRLDREKAEAARALAFERILLGCMLVLAVLVGGGVFWSIRGIQAHLHELAGKLREGAAQVHAAANQVSVSSQSLSQGATQQAASIEETSASMEEMASMTRRNAENSEQAAALMSQVHHQVAASDRMLGDMVGSMAAIKESSGKVARIIKTIDEIAFQTNILALNAAVEAARAGEAGMGFAVVADEVRNLAQRAAQAARDTASLIEEAASNAGAGSVKVEQVADAIRQFTTSVTQVKAIADEVSVASSQQSQGIGQVTQSLGEMERVTQTTAATAEESAAASQELQSQAQTTMALVGDLEALLGRHEENAGRSLGASPVERRFAANRLGQKGRIVQLPTAAGISSHDRTSATGDGTFGAA